MNTMTYAQSNESVALLFNILTADLSQLSNALIFPSQTQEFETPKNYDHDPITPEEEMDLAESNMDVINGRVVRFSASDSREDILRHLGLL